MNYLGVPSMIMGAYGEPGKNPEKPFGGLSRSEESLWDEGALL